MKVDYSGHQRRTIKGKEEIFFSSFSAFHLLTVTARVKDKKQLSPTATDDEDLTVKIDGQTFPKEENNHRLIDSPAAFSGGTLHNLAKTVYFLVFLKGKDHTITLETDKPSQTAALENVTVQTIDPTSDLINGQTLTLPLEVKAEDGDCRPWLTFVLENLPLISFTSTISYSRRKRDSDDVKILVNGQVQGNLLTMIKHFLWRYVGSRLPPFSTKTGSETYKVNLPKGHHLLEFHADRTPKLHQITFNFGAKPQPPIRVPTAEDPRWTGDFYDDPEDILLARLIFGEARNQPREAKEWIAWSIINRAKSSAWPNTTHGVILQKDQYDPIKPTDGNYPYVTDPLRDGNSADRDSWKESFEVANIVLKGDINNPTQGATHFHGVGIEREWFEKHIVPQGHYIKNIGDTYFYWSPN